MKKLLLSSVALLGLTTGAIAADLPRGPVVAPPPAAVAAPVFTWTGFYVGINVGAAFADNNRDNSCGGGFFGFGDCFGGSGLSVQRTNGFVAPVVPLTRFNTFVGNGFDGFLDNRNDSAFSGGGQIGYNWQLTPG